MDPEGKARTCHRLFRSKAGSAPSQPVWLLPAAALEIVEWSKKGEAYGYGSSASASASAVKMDQLCAHSFNHLAHCGSQGELRESVGLV